MTIFDTLIDWYISFHVTGFTVLMSAIAIFIGWLMWSDPQEEKPHAPTLRVVPKVASRTLPPSVATRSLSQDRGVEIVGDQVIKKDLARSTGGVRGAQSHRRDH